MKNKKFIVTLGFIVLVVSGAFLFWHTKKQDDAKKHAEDTYRRMTDMAKKSAVSGMPRMARALNRYRKDNQNYPPTLQSLYPKYIQRKFFIDEVPWQYKRRGNNFLLSKSILRGGQTLVASIDNTLKPDTGKKAMLATARQSAPKKTASPPPARPAATTLAKKEKPAAPTPTKKKKEPAQKKASMNPPAVSDFYKKNTACRFRQHLKVQLS